MVFLAVGIVSAASLLQLFRAPDGWFYDRVVRLGGWRLSGDPAVLMVEVDVRTELSADDWLAVLTHLEQMGAGQLVFMDPPSSAFPALYRQAEEHRNVILGRILVPDPDSGWAATLDPESTPGPVALPDLPVGAVLLPTSEFGVHRRAATAARVSGRELPTLARVVAFGPGRHPQQGEYLVNFNNGQNWLPRVSMERLLDKGLIEELVGGRTVLIGTLQPPGQPALYTPISVGRDGMSLLEYQAHAIDTLLRGKAVQLTPWGLNLVLLGMIGLLSLVVYQWFNLDRSSWFTLVLIGSYLGLAWLLLHGLEIWIPVAEMAVVQLLMLWMFVRFKLLRDDQEMRRIVLQQMARLQEYILPPDFYELDEHWAQVISFIDQTLNLNRVIFLEKVKGDHRVREVQALRCSLEDIDERRRDYERLPYSDAIAEGGPVRLQQRLFFKDAESAAEQYLVPLVFGGEVQGFWAFDVDPVVTESAERFLGNIRDFGVQVAALLYHRHRRIEQRRAETGVFRRLFRLEATNESYQEVAELLSLLDHRLMALDGVFDGLATAAIHYDLFGRVVQLNRSMEEFMGQVDLPGYRLTALDLLVEIAGIPQDRARILLQQVVVDHRNFHLPMSPGSAQAEHYSIFVRPLEAREVEGVLTGAATPFQLAGILFEFIDTRRLVNRSEFKEQLLEWFRLRLHQDLDVGAEATAVADERAVAAGGLAVQEISAAASPREWPGSVAERGGSALLSTLELVQEALAVDVRAQSTSSYPVDARPLLMAVVEDRSKVVSDRGIELQPEVPRLLGLVRVLPQQLQLLFQAILDVLIRDAAADTALGIHVVEQAGFHHYSFRNTGFGIPDEHLQGYLWGPGDNTVNGEFHDLRQALRPLADWEGVFQIHSEVGVGVWAELRLKVVS